MISKPDAKKLGLRTEILDQLDTLFKSYKEIDAVVLYGSRAKGTFRPNQRYQVRIPKVPQESQDSGLNQGF